MRDDPVNLCMGCKIQGYNTFIKCFTNTRDNCYEKFDSVDWNQTESTENLLYIALTQLDGKSKQSSRVASKLKFLLKNNIDITKLDAKNNSLDDVFSIMRISSSFYINITESKTFRLIDVIEVVKLLLEYGARPDFSKYKYEPIISMILGSFGYIDPKCSSIPDKSKDDQITKLSDEINELRAINESNNKMILYTTNELKELRDRFEQKEETNRNAPQISNSNSFEELHELREKFEYYIHKAEEEHKEYINEIRELKNVNAATYQQLEEERQKHKEYINEIRKLKNINAATYQQLEEERQKHKEYKSNSKIKRNALLNEIARYKVAKK